jgi:ankyrin repeat protein
MRNKRLILSLILFLGIGLTWIQVQAQTDPKTGSITEIHQAVIAGDLNKVRVLIDSDSTLLELKNNHGETPLIVACKTRQIAIANYLIDKGANVNAKTGNGITPLFSFRRDMDNCLVLVQRLIDKGADVNAKLLLDRNWTVLLNTVALGNQKAAKLLIDHGADININDIAGTLLQMIINGFYSEWNKDMAVLLIESGAKLQEFSYGNTELHLVAINGRTDLVPVLVKYGADVNAINDYKHTALYYATTLGHQKVADELIAAGANKGTIVETNYGKAPQLSKTLKDNEAYLWYLSGMSSGYAVKTKGHLLIFNPEEIDESQEGGLANGHINSKELAGQKITVLITQWAGQDISKLAEAMPSANFILSYKPDDYTQPNGGLTIVVDSSLSSKIPPYRLANPNENISMGGGVQVHTTAVTDNEMMGNSIGYLVEADGLKIFYAGLQSSDNDSLHIIKYRKDIDTLKPFGPIDIAILPINGNHQDVAYEPYLYLIDQLSPKVIYLMGDKLITKEHTKCIEVLRARNIQVAYPEGGLAMGERFHFYRDSK